MRRFGPTPWVTGPEMPPPEPQGRRRIIRAAALTALAMSVIYLVWRGAFTLNLSAWWISVPLYVLEIAGFIALALFTYSLWDIDSLLAPPQVTRTNARLAVLIPTYDEDEEILLPTVAAAVAMQLEHETWVLDDGDRLQVRRLADALGARYLARSSHEHAKAGNLNNALNRVDADIVAIFDADHVPDPSFFPKTLGYFDDPEIAVVQTPQDFYNVTSFEHIDLQALPVWDRQPVHEETVFYRVIGPGKNRWDAAFWCGTNALVRVAALRDIGGVRTETVTEDIHSSVELQKRGWRVVYHNEVLARGLAATNAGQFRLQRHRWATGAMQLMRAEHPIVTRRLKLRQRIAYAATLLAWFDSWRALAYLLVPIVVLATGASPIETPLPVFIAAFGITFLLQQGALNLLSRGYHHPLISARFELMRLGATLSGTLTLLRNKARKFQVTPKGRTGTDRHRDQVPGGLIALLALHVAAAIWFALTQLGLTPLHYGTPGVAWGALFWLFVNSSLLIAAMRWITASRYATELRRSVRFPLADPASIDGHAGTMVDCSLGGARVDYRDPGALEEFHPGTSARLEVHLTGATLALDALIRSVRGSDDRVVHVAVEFAPHQLQARAALATALFDGVVAPAFDAVLVPSEPPEVHLSVAS
jgi:cellulose synthase/poly-beta-1,6-N-acetylglucosamine synthase-like glycosyltransferase